MLESFPILLHFRLAFGIEQGVVLIGFVQEFSWLLQFVIKETVQIHISCSWYFQMGMQSSQCLLFVSRGFKVVQLSIFRELFRPSKLHSNGQEEGRISYSCMHRTQNHIIKIGSTSCRRCSKGLTCSFCHYPHINTRR